MRHATCATLLRARCRGRVALRGSRRLHGDEADHPDIATARPPGGATGCAPRRRGASSSGPARQVACDECARGWYSSGSQCLKCDNLDAHVLLHRIARDAKLSRSPESNTTTAPCRIAPDAKPERYRGASNTTTAPARII